MVFHLMETMNKLKVFALVMIGLLIIATGLRFTYLEVHEFPLNETQKIFAINTAKDGLRDEIGGNNYNTTVQDRGRTMSTANGDKKVVRVVLTRENITITALVDMDTGSVVEKTRVESSGWMTEYQDQNPKRWGHQRLFNR
jgi:hypothetical protein